MITSKVMLISGFTVLFIMQCWVNTHINVASTQVSGKDNLVLFLLACYL